jgi:hypothetical protein
MTAVIGSALLMDTVNGLTDCLHCGGATSSTAGNRRRILYVTFQIPRSKPHGSSSSACEIKC